MQGEHMRAYVAKLRQGQSGFTLIEIMVVVVIIGLLAAIIAPNVMRQLDRATVTRAETDIKQLESALGIFYTEHFRYPTADEGLSILTGKPTAGSSIDESRLSEIIKAPISKDPWQREYRYRNPGEHGTYDVYSLGADGEEGGENMDADIGNWPEDELASR
jgi:general secretion pathway protein G